MRDPFASLGGYGKKDGYSVEDAAIFGKSDEESENIGRGGFTEVTIDGDKEIETEIVAPTVQSGEDSETDVPEKINWMEDQRSDNEMARRSAFLDAPMGVGPRELIERRDGAMGIYNNQLQTGEGMVDLSKEQKNDYLNRGDAFLKDVMSGKITLGQNNEEAVTYPVEDVDVTDFTSTIPVDIGTTQLTSTASQMFTQQPSENIWEDSTYLKPEDVRGMIDPLEGEQADSEIYDNFDFRDVYDFWQK